MFEALHSAGPLFVLSIIILIGVSFGALARRLGLPGMTGQILGGIALGHAGLDLFGSTSVEALEPITFVALGLIAVTVGGHLNMRHLRNAGSRLSLLIFAEVTLTPTLVFFALTKLGGASVEMALLLAMASIATAPATIVGLVKEARARGVFVKTLVAAVALNNLACIFLFEVAREFCERGLGSEMSIAGGLGAPLAKLVVALAIGGSIALLVDLLSGVVGDKDRLTAIALAALVAAVGLARLLGVSPLLTCLFLGLIQTNVTRTRDRLVDAVFGHFEPVILAVFFTLAGMHISFEYLGTAGLLALVYFLARCLGKWGAAHFSMSLAKATKNVRQYLGIALIPQSGVVIGLAVLIQQDPILADLSGLFSAVVLTAVIANEVIGPLATRYALDRAGEVDKDRMRLIDFIHEEHILTEFSASSMQDAIEKLVNRLMATHPLENIDGKTLLSSVLEREAQSSTCFGGGLAVPHCILPEGHAMVGVMALSREGLNLPTPDGRPVHCMVLLGTSPGERGRHLEVLASLARAIGHDLSFQARLFNAGSPAHADELLHGEESEGFNYFLE